ncbi:MAG: Uma2 family endonuclease [Planctomycetes bacterium]|nr:Uma2 family endonuclease [Planctomycetota bacterium]
MQVMRSAERRINSRNGISLALPDGNFEIPVSAQTLAGFRAWATSDEFPKRGHISFLDGEIIIDTSPERLETHGLVKNEIATAITLLNKRIRRGIYLPDRTLVSNKDAGLSTEPDGAFVTKTTVRTGKARFVYTETEPKNIKEIEGTPDWVLEVISPGSEKKDNQLMEMYHKAGIPEFWLVDAREEDLVFVILLHTPKKYRPAPRRGVWHYSRVFKRWFRLRRKKGILDIWEYHLDSKKM